MVESKSETNVNHGEWAIVHYIFPMYGRKIVFYVMDNERV
jgi:hypothetical protein